MLSKINLKRVAVTAGLIFAMAFVATGAQIPDAITGGDWSAVKDLAVSGVLAGLGAVTEALFHMFTPGKGDGTQ